MPGTGWGTEQEAEEASQSICFPLEDPLHENTKACSSPTQAHLASSRCAVLPFMGALCTHRRQDPLPPKGYGSL